jgi:hypothetical protein
MAVSADERVSSRYVLNSKIFAKKSLIKAQTNFRKCSLLFFRYYSISRSMKVPGQVSPLCITCFVMYARSIYSYVHLRNTVFL